MKRIYFAGGCFWGTEHMFKQVRGVVATTAGYANGCGDNPTYEQVYSDKTGYVETVCVEYNPEEVSLGLLVELYFRSIDPLSINRQGGDCGTRYRTGIYYTDDEDIPIIEEKYRCVEEQIGEPLAVEFEPLVVFYAAEEYHQDYLDKNPAGYCHLSIDLMRLAYHINRH